MCRELNPEEVFIPFSQHIGKPASPVKAVGDYVERGEILAEAAEWPGEIDIKRAEAAQKRAEERLQAHSSDTDMARAETALLRAVARIEALR